MKIISRSRRRSRSAVCDGPAAESLPPVSPGAFTVLELLVVAAILGILAVLVLPALSQTRESARRATCIDNLRQLGLAAEMYWDEHDDRPFPYLLGSTNGGRTYWFGWLKPGDEGEREFDASRGVLFPYLDGQGVGICPSFDYQSTLYKRKAQGAASSYGYNLHLAERLRSPIRSSEITLFADAAQINDFQAPASPGRPLLEEFYYVDQDAGTGYPNAHFRHRLKANVLFCDGHVGTESPVPGSLDERMPEQNVGRLRADCLRPRVSLP